jgi:hypothetical protein
MNHGQKYLSRLAVMVPFAALLYSSPALAQVSLGTAEDFAVLGGSALTFTGSAVRGDVGLDLVGGVVTQTGSTISGTVYVGDTVAQRAYDDFLAAYAALAARPCGTFLTVLSGQTLRPGVYCVSAAATETGGVLTLNGSSTDTWIFKIGTGGTGALTGTNFSVVMPGADMCNNNVFWWTAEAATLTDSVFVGSILSGAAITVTRGSVDGQAMAKAAVTITSKVSTCGFVSGAGEGLFPPGATYLGVPLKGLDLGMGLGVAGDKGVGQFQATLTSISALQDILVEGVVSSSVPSGPNTAVFSGTSNVDPGNGAPVLPGVPFTATVVANPDGTGTLTLNLGGTNLPVVAMNEGYLMVQ